MEELITYIVIPARLESTRLPNKLLLRETGKTLLQHTYENALGCKEANWVCIATDSIEVREEVFNFAPKSFPYLTGKHHHNGTSRISEIVDFFPLTVKYIVNVQGDEPRIDPNCVDELIKLLKTDKFDVVTLYSNLQEEEKNNRSVVKIIVDDDQALFFTRDYCSGAFKHIGVYGYKRDILIRYHKLKESFFGNDQGLEQIKFLKNKLSIGVILVDYHGRGIDTREDYDVFVKECQLCQVQ